MSEVTLGGHPRFYEVRRENEKLYSAKHYMYATDADPMSNFRLAGQLIRKLLKPGVDPTIAAALTLMSKQIVGVYEIVGEGKANTIESLEDKLKDIEIYASILQVLVDETKPKAASEFNFDRELKALYRESGMLQSWRLPACCECEALAERQSTLTDLFWCRSCAEKHNLDFGNMTLMSADKSL